MSEPIQSIAQNNYILQAPLPTATMFTTALEYDSSGFISGYAGSAFKAGDTLPESVSAATDYVTATSGNINDTISAVTTNSGTWGGSALPISAGPGIKVNLVDNTLVFSNDETVLYSGTYNTNVSSISLSEPTTNFETIKVYWQHQTVEKPVFEYDGNSEQWYAIGGRYVTPNNVPCVFQCFWSGNYNQYNVKFCNFQFGSLTAEPQVANELVPIKVVGVNRKENA